MPLYAFVEIDRRYRTNYHYTQVCILCHDLTNYLRQWNEVNWRRLWDWSFCPSLCVCVCMCLSVCYTNWRKYAL